GFAHPACADRRGGLRQPAAGPRPSGRLRAIGPYAGDETVRDRYDERHVAVAAQVGGDDRALEGPVVGGAVERDRKAGQVGRRVRDLAGERARGLRPSSSQAEGDEREHHERSGGPRKHAGEKTGPTRRLGHRWTSGDGWSSLFIPPILLSRNLNDA